jgi:hypothetical protein
MAEKSNVSGKVEILRKIGRLRAEHLILVLKYLWALRSKDKLSELAKIYVERTRLEAEIAELRKQYDEIDKGGK